MPRPSPHPPPLTSHDHFERVLDAARASVRPGAPLDRELAGHGLRLSFSNEALEAKLFPALQHLAPFTSFTEGLHVICWSSSPEEFGLDGAPWSMQEHWTSQEVLSVRCERGFVACDSRSGVVSSYDREARVASLWTPSANDLSFWVSGAPLLSILNWWLADHDVSLCHAAAVGRPGKAVLLAGPSGSGKSTTAVAALDSRLLYLGDDYVAVGLDPEPTVFSLYNSAKLEATQLRRDFAPLSVRVSRTEGADHGKALFFVAETHPHKLLRRAPAAALMVPRIADASAPALVRIGSAAAFKALAPSTVFQLPGNTHEKYAMLSRLARRLPTYALHLSRSRHANTELLQRFVEE